ncbi:tail fiber assembly protein [Serratia bockelmannii]|uniref:tail fiber assembly protein n=1 Tax=Serratia bockelmannii TaxID=2703793 RepID=UPI003FA743AA
MNKYGPFSLYTPAPGTPIGELARRIKAQFICTSDKQDWYELQKALASGVLKVVYADNGVITQASFDASALWPINASVAEVTTEQIPRGFTLPLSTADWQYNGTRIVPRVYTSEELQQQAARHKQKLMAEAEAVIAPLSRAVRLEIATDEEKDLFDAWERYSVLLNRVDVSGAPDIAWPDQPA